MAMTVKFAVIWPRHQVIGHPKLAPSIASFAGQQFNSSLQLCCSLACLLACQIETISSHLRTDSYFLHLLLLVLAVAVVCHFIHFNHNHLSNATISSHKLDLITSLTTIANCSGSLAPTRALGRVNLVRSIVLRLFVPVGEKRIFQLETRPRPRQAQLAASKQTITIQAPNLIPIPIFFLSILNSLRPMVLLFAPHVHCNLPVSSQRPSVACR